MTVYKFFFTLLKIVITIIVVILAFTLTRDLWNRYMNTSWTRDGRVRADVITVAPDVSGLVTEVAVKDNQYVKKGDLLMRIDPERYRLALRQADAMVDQQRIALNTRQSDAKRRASLDGEVISRETVETFNANATQAEAAYRSALASRELAALNLSRTDVYASVDGWVTNLTVRAGDYAQTGAAKLALIDAHSFWVYGYFEENKIELIRAGDRADIRLLGSRQIIKGHVEGIARGITDRDNTANAGLLANVNPSFNWVRLAQRVPVRIAIDEVPEGVTLSAGMTCNIETHPTAPRKQPAAVAPSRKQ